MLQMFAFATIATLGRDFPSRSEVNDYDFEYLSGKTLGALIGIRVSALRYRMGTLFLFRRFQNTPAMMPTTTPPMRSGIMANIRR